MLCQTCDTETVMLLNADFVCDCNVRLMQRFASPKMVEYLRRAIAFQRAEFPSCDRCDAVDADGLVRCYLGCTHAECLACAGDTLDERKQGERWDASKLNGLLPGPRPRQPLHPVVGRVDAPGELLRRLG